VLFNSLNFIVFFAVVLAIYALPLWWPSKKAVLLLASYVFYAAWNPPFVALLWLSTVVDWLVARRLYRSTHPTARRAWLAVSLATNLGLLAFFKYGTFFLENWNVISGFYGLGEMAFPWNIILPVGISFYTFQTLSYTIDVYRKELTPTNSLLDFALYVSFFPQLVAGPIVRARDFLPQLIQPKAVTARHLGWGLNLLLLGLFQKIVLADHLLAPVVTAVYDSGGVDPNRMSAWAATFAFSGQIFFDFAGYSTCAIGIAMCLGFALPDNFHFPYAARGFSDFWRRWHISLSSWLRDYVYIALGGNRKGVSRTQINLALTMLIGGLWHGAAWTFVFWGGLHGSYLIAERWARRSKLGQAGLWNSGPGQLALVLVTYLAVCIAWVFFRAPSFGAAFSIVKPLFGFEMATAQALLEPGQCAIAFAVTALLLGGHYVLREQRLEQVVDRIPGWLLVIGNAFMLASIVFSGGEDRAFIYFQF